MAIRWGRLAEALKSRHESLSERERFALFLATQWGRAVGGEGERGTDGAEGVRLALCAATGLVARGNVDDLMQEVFTRKNPASDEIQAAFFVTRKDRLREGQVARKGTATHVAGVVGRGVVVSFEYPRAAFRTLDELWSLCGLWDYDLRVRGLDRGALERVSIEGAWPGDAEASVEECFEEVEE